MKAAILADLSWHHGFRLASAIAGSMEILAISQAKPIDEPKFPFKMILKGNLNATQYLALGSQYNNLLDAFKPDIIHASNVMVNGVFAGEYKKAPFVDTILGSDLFMLKNKAPEMQQRILNSLKAASTVTADTSELITLAANYGVARERLMFWTMGVDTNLFDPEFDHSQITRAYDLNHYPVILSGRRLAPLYNHESIIQAFAKLLPNYPDAILVFLGDFISVEYEKTILKLILNLKLTNSVRFIPPMPYPMLPAVYTASTIWVSMPFSDGLPVSLLEALACGIAILAHDPGSLNDWVDQTGTYISNPSPDAILDGLTRILALGKKEWKKYSKIGRQMVVETFEMSLLVDTIIEKYGEITGA